MDYKELLENCGIKAFSNSKGDMTFEGYLAVFDNIDSYGDVIVKGAFEQTLKEIEEKGTTIFVLENHGGWGTTSTDKTPIGYFKEMKEDEHGLFVKGQLYSTARGKDIYSILKESPKGTVGMSIGYRARKVVYPDALPQEKREKGVDRYLTEIELREGSIVTFPANTEARVLDVKSEALKKRELESLLRENGFSVKESVKISSIVSKHISMTEEPIKQQSNFDEEELKNVQKSLTDACSSIEKLLSKKENTDDQQQEGKKDFSVDLVKSLQELQDNIKTNSLLSSIENLKNTIKLDNN